MVLQLKNMEDQYKIYKPPNIYIRNKFSEGQYH